MQVVRRHLVKFPIILVPGFIIILLTAFFYFFLVWRVSSTLVEQVLFKAELAGKAGASSTKMFVENLGFQTSIFATRINIVTPNPQDTPLALKNLVDGMSSTPMTGAILADSRGRVLYGHEKPGPFAGGEDISDREYFKWAESAKEGEIYIGSPIRSKLGFSKGRYIVPIASPIIKEGKFNGVFVTAFFVDELVNQYLNDLKITGNTRIYIIDNKGVIIASPRENLLGINYLDYLKSLNIEGGSTKSGILYSALTSEKAGAIDISLPDETKNRALTRFLIGYAPVKLRDSAWVMAIAVPASDTLASLYPLQFRDLGIIGLVVLVSIVIAFYIERLLDILGKGSKVVKTERVR